MKKYIAILSCLLMFNSFAQDLIDESISFNTCEIYDQTNLATFDSISGAIGEFKIFEGFGELNITWDFLQNKGFGHLIYKNDEEEGLIHLILGEFELLNDGTDDTLTVIYSGIMQDENHELISVAKILVERTFNPFSEVFVIYSNFEKAAENAEGLRQAKLTKVYY